MFLINLKNNIFIKSNIKKYLNKKYMRKKSNTRKIKNKSKLYSNREAKIV